MYASDNIQSCLVAVLIVTGLFFANAASGHEGTAPQLQHAINAGDSNLSKSNQKSSVWSQSTFSLPGLDGTVHTLADWKGKVIMLNFWATWCAPCQAEITDFIAFQDEYRANGLQIIGLGMDKEQKLRNAQRTLEINYPILIADPERNSKLMGQWGNSSGIVPYTVVIDQDGLVRYTHRGPLHRDAFDENILPLLGKN